MSTNALSYIRQVPELAPLLAGADHIDVKTATGEVSMREFIAAMVAFQPFWITFLYSIRAVFVRFLGMRQQRLPHFRPLRPDEVPMQPGSRLVFFKVRMAEEERYWVAEADDRHLNGALCVVVEPLSDNQRRFHVVTIVHYHNWTGPVYFNVIRPFHHIVVGSMVRAGLRGT